MEKWLLLLIFVYLFHERCVEDRKFFIGRPICGPGSSVVAAEAAVHYVWGLIRDEIFFAGLRVETLWLNDSQLGILVR